MSSPVISASPDLLGQLADRLESTPDDPRLAWRRVARPDQLLPAGEWRIWYIQGGRGSGKTRSGAQGLAEWILSDDEPGDWGIIAPTYRDAWTTCVEGESGILRALGTSIAEIKEGRSATVRAAWRTYGEVILHSGHVIRVDSANDGALRVQGKNLKGAWCIAADVAIVTLGGTKAIRDVRPGDHVLTRQGYRRVLKAIRTGRSLPVVEVAASDGSTVRCTREHRIWTENRGWQEAANLQAGDRLCLAPRPGSTSPGEGSTGSRPATTPPATADGQDASTWRSGNPSTDAPSRQGTSSTTLTTTRKITTRATWPPWSTATTTGIIALLSSAQRRLAHGSRQASLSLGPAGSQERSPARSAAASSRHAHPGASSGSAQPAARVSPASRPLQVSPAGYPATPTARTAASGSRPRTGAPGSALRTAQVAAVRPSGKADVYDLTIDGEPEFFAGGILVHNCDEIGLWAKWSTAWDESIAYAVRRGVARIIATGTPKISRPAAKLIRRLIRDDSGVVVTRLRTLDNIKNLSRAFYQAVVARATGTRLERQELEGELLDDVENALWTRDLLESIQVDEIPGETLREATIGVDPADGTEEGDEQAYTVSGIGGDGRLYVAESWGGRIGPVPFLKRVVQVADRWNASVVLEKNHGGAYLVATLVQVMRELEITVPYQVVHASQAKRTRAEPVAALYERDVVRHANGPHVELEDQQCVFTGGSGERSPDRLDSLCWSVTPFLHHDFDFSGKPRQLGARNWSASAELQRLGQSPSDRRRERTGQPREQDEWGLDSFAPQDERPTRRNVRSWR